MVTGEYTPLCIHCVSAKACPTCASLSPLPPDILADARQDVIHENIGNCRAGQSVRTCSTSPGLTHYAGCACYEAERDAEVERLREELNGRLAEMALSRLETKEQCAEVERLREELNEAQSHVAVLRDCLDDAVTAVSHGRLASIGGIESHYAPKIRTGTVNRWARALNDAASAAKAHEESIAAPLLAAIRRFVWDIEMNWFEHEAAYDLPLADKFGAYTNLLRIAAPDVE